jgi:hypothetical protein
MAVAVVLVQLPDALNGAAPEANRFFEAMHGIELPLALFAAAGALVFLGGGRLSLDALFHIEDLVRKKKTAAAAAVVANQT